MKNRWLSLLLCVLLVLSALTGCQNKKTEKDILDDAADAARETMTLTMWLVTEEGTTPEAVGLVEEAINKILKSKYKTRIELSVFTEDEYYAALDAKLLAIGEYMNSDEYYDILEKEEEMAEEGITTEPEETILNEWGIPEEKYPGVGKGQLDIIFLSGNDNYLKYSQSDDLAVLERLDDQLKQGSKKLNSYIDPQFFTAYAANGGTYAIPNRHVIGEYAFLLTNRELVDKYFYDPDDLNTVAKCESFIQDVVKYEKDITPIKQLDYPLYTTYWSDNGERSLLSSIGNASMMESTYLAIKNTLTNSRFTDQMRTLIGYQEKGYIAADPTTVDKFGMAVIKGGAELEAIYGEDYYMTVLEAPLASEEEMFEAMFGVTMYTKSLERSMEVITLLNTDPTIRNLLQYGIEGVHYQLTEDEGTVKRLNNDYMMDIVKTGNTFMAYPEEGQPADLWEYGKKQNLDVIISPFNGFSFYDSGLDEELMGRVAELSKTYFERLDACTTLESLNAFLDAAKTELASNEDLKKALSTTEDGSPNMIYTDWYYTKYPPEDE